MIRQEQNENIVPRRIIPPLARGRREGATADRDSHDNQNASMSGERVLAFHDQPASRAGKLLRIRLNGWVRFPESLVLAGKLLHAQDTRIGFQRHVEPARGIELRHKIDIGHAGLRPKA